MIKKINSNKKVLLAISGGVDSTTSALLLKEKGYDVTGIHFIIPSNYKNRNKKDNINLTKIKKLSKALKIPLIIKDIRKYFIKEIIEFIINQYKKGITPNPCAVCNKKIKFNNLICEADKKSIQNIATGHYAKNTTVNLNNEENYFIVKAKDRLKDQSYFLTKLSDKTIKRTIFPLGDIKKIETYKIAKANNYNFEKKDESMGLCFLKVEFEKFIKDNIKNKQGKILDHNKKQIGIHKGLTKYTLGQRKGVRIGENGPYFVIKKDFKNNILYVSNIGDDPNLFSNKINFKIKHIPKKRLLFLKKWLSETSKQQKNNQFKPKNLKVKIRYTKKDHKISIIEFKKNQIQILTNEQIRAITKGQIAAVYSGDILVFGGEIF